MSEMTELETTLRLHIQSSDEKHRDAQVQFNRIWESLSGKASYTVTWVLVGIISALLGVIWYTTVDIAKSQQRTEQTVAEIRGKLEPFNIEFIK